MIVGVVGKMLVLISALIITLTVVPLHGGMALPRRPNKHIPVMSPNMGGSDPNWLNPRQPQLPGGRPMGRPEGMEIPPNHSGDIMKMCNLDGMASCLKPMASVFHSNKHDLNLKYWLNPFNKIYWQNPNGTDLCWLLHPNKTAVMIPEIATCFQHTVLGCPFPRILERINHFTNLSIVENFWGDFCTEGCNNLQDIVTEIQSNCTTRVDVLYKSDLTKANVTAAMRANMTKEQYTYFPLTSEQWCSKQQALWDCRAQASYSCLGAEAHVIHLFTGDNAQHKCNLTLNFVPITTPAPMVTTEAEVEEESREVYKVHKEVKKEGRNHGKAHSEHNVQVVSTGGTVVICKITLVMAPLAAMVNGYWPN